VSKLAGVAVPVLWGVAVGELLISRGCGVVLAEDLWKGSA
jgi:hypothetical protein